MTIKRFLIGQRFSLAGLRECDVAEGAPYYQWMDNLDLDIHTERGRFPNHPTKHRSYYERTGAGNDLVMLGIYDNESGRHIGNVSYKDINWQSRRGFLGYIIGEKEYAGQGIASEAVGMFMLYGFQKLNFRRIFTTIALSNVGSIKVAERNGFEREGIMKKHIQSGDRELDVAMFGVMASDWMPVHADRTRTLFKSSPF